MKPSTKAMVWFTLQKAFHRLTGREAKWERQYREMRAQPVPPVQYSPVQYGFWVIETFDTHRTDRVTGELRRHRPRVAHLEDTCFDDYGACLEAMAYYWRSLGTGKPDYVAPHDEDIIGVFKIDTLTGNLEVLHTKDEIEELARDTIEREGL